MRSILLSLTIGLFGSASAIGPMALRSDQGGSASAGPRPAASGPAATLCMPVCQVEGHVDVGSAPVLVHASAPVSITLDVGCETRAPLASTAADIVLVFDYSYSMVVEEDYLALAKTAVRDLLTGLDPGQHRLGAIAYKSKPTVLSLLTGNFSAVQREIDSLTATTELASSSIYLALSKVEYVLRGDRRPGVPAIVLILGEGDIEENDPVPVADQLRADGVHVYAISFTDAPTQVQHLKRIVAFETHYFSGLDLALVQLAIRGLLHSPPTPVIKDLHLEVEENGDLPIVPQSATPAATESAGRLVWELRSVHDGSYPSHYAVSALSPGTFPVARAITASYEACPGTMRHVELAVPDVLVVVPTVTVEATPTGWVPTIVATREPSATRSPTATTVPTATLDAASPPVPTPSHAGQRDLYVPLTFRRPRR